MLFTFSASPPSCSLGPAPVALFLFLKHARLLSVSGIYLLWTRALGLLNQSKFIRGTTGNSGKALLGPRLRQRGVRPNNGWPCFCMLSLRGGTRGEGQIVPRGRAGGAAWVFCPPLKCCCVQGAWSVPCFCFQHRFFFFFCYRLFKSGSWVFWSFCIFWVQNLLQLLVSFSPI